VCKLLQWKLVISRAVVNIIIQHCLSFPVSYLCVILSAMSKFVDYLVMNWYIMFIEYIEVTLTGWSEEHEICFTDYYK
jgi:hypothetical protein